jgi:hypothetical protein
MRWSNCFDARSISDGGNVSRLSVAATLLPSFCLPWLFSSLPIHPIVKSSALSHISFFIQRSNMPHATSGTDLTTSTAETETDKIGHHLTESILTLRQTINNIREDVVDGIAPSILMPADSVCQPFRTTFEDSDLTCYRCMMLRLE